MCQEDCMAIREILRLGNPVLRIDCAPVTSFESGRLGDLVADLRDTLENFRRSNGFGRAIAAPQIGVTERIIYIDAGEPVAMVNPVIVRRSRKQMTLWDDCFSFPDLMVRVKRNLAVLVRYQDREGRKQELDAEGSLSELLQHEIDHVHGILAVDRAIDSKHIVYRTELERAAKERMEVVL
jgi:peptide deformylase